MAEGAEKVDATVSAVRKVAEQRAVGTYSEGFAYFLPKPQLRGPPWAVTFMDKVVWHFPVSLLLPRLNFKVGGGGRAGGQLFNIWKLLAVFEFSVLPQ